MTPRARTENTVQLPPPVEEDGYPDGDGPAWISTAIGVPGCVDAVMRHLSDDGEETSLLLRFGNGRELIIKPARLVTTRRLAELLGALGFPVPYYSPAQIARVGQAIGRVADRDLAQVQERSYEATASVVVDWLQNCLTAHDAYVLTGRAGVDVRAAVAYVQRGLVGGDPRVPLVVEPGRVVQTLDGEQITGALLAWRVPVTMAIRDRLGTTSDGHIGLALTRAGVTRDRLAARPALAERRTHDLPVWVVHNGWQGVEVQMPDEAWRSGAVKLDAL